jgi:hypothetical protein
METNWAADHLQTIRTLMERSALYRRALAPIMSFCGVAGIAGGLIGGKVGIGSMRGFVLFWIAIAIVALVGSFILVRRQALKDSEPFWSPPTRRVAQALTAPFFVGSFIGAFTVTVGKGDEVVLEYLLVLTWASLYGCAIHSAGFFVQRGIKLFGWLFILAGCAMLGGFNQLVGSRISPYLLMGGIFGGLHLAYGVYLYFTEKEKNAT